MRALCTLSAALWLGCAPTWPAVLDPADVASLSEGTPHIRGVRDLGPAHIGHAGPLQAQSDGVFTVGELVLIEGRGFGKLPTVGIGGRPAELLWRTAGGGIVVRLPVGGPAGPQTITVQAAGGRAEAPVTIRRLGVVVDRSRGQIHSVDVGAAPQPTLRPAGPPLGLKDAGAVAMAFDGSVAYVAAGSRVAAIELGAAGGPRLAAPRPVSHPVTGLAAAERAPVLAVLGPQRLTLWDVRDAARPAPWPAATLPDEVAGFAAGALDPTGAVLALAVPDGNRVVLLDVRPGTQAVKPAVLGQVEILPGARQALLLDLRFASDGETLWVLSGDSGRSAALGHQPARLSAVRVGRSADGAQPLSLLRTVELPEVGAPLGLSLGRAAPPASGAAIRTPPEQSAVYLSAVRADGFTAGAGAPGRATPGTPGTPGTIVRLASLETGQTAVVAGDRDGEVLPALDVGPDGAVLGASCADGSQGFGAVLLRADVAGGAGGAASGAAPLLQSGHSFKLPLGPGDARCLRAPFTGAAVALQP